MVELSLAYCYIPNRELSIACANQTSTASGQKVCSFIEILAATGTASGDGGKSALVSPRPGASSITVSAAFLLIVKDKLNHYLLSANHVYKKKFEEIKSSE